MPKDQVKDYSKYVAKKDEMWLGKIEAKAAVRQHAGPERSVPDSAPGLAACWPVCSR